MYKKERDLKTSSKIFFLVAINGLGWTVHHELALESAIYAMERGIQLAIPTQTWMFSVGQG